jgi:hypothetical protein
MREEEVTSSAMTGDEEGEEKTEMRKRKENIKSRWEQEKGGEENSDP